MEKVIIVTVYNSENSGSYLQAYALGYVLKNLGYEVAYYQRSSHGSSHAIKPHIIWSLKKLAKFKIKAAMYPLQTWWIYHKAQKVFPICTSTSSFYKEAKFVIIGSDTLWNFASDYFSNHAELYTGKPFMGKSVITYAISAANTEVEKFKSVIRGIRGLDNIDTILVRDEHTQTLVRSVCPQECDIVSDPSLLLLPDEYMPLEKQLQINKPYLLLYYFGKIEDALKVAITEYAQKNNLSIVSMSEVRSWAHKCVHSSPSNMVSYFKHATCILTNTFHGTAFSLIFGKRFAVYNCNSNKVRQLLCLYKQSYRLFSDAYLVESIFSYENNVHSSGIYDEQRNNSIRLLNNALKKTL